MKLTQNVIRLQKLVESILILIEIARATDQSPLKLVNSFLSTTFRTPFSDANISEARESFFCLKFRIKLGEYSRIQIKEANLDHRK